MASGHSFWILRGGVDYVDKWFLMGSAYPVFLIVGFYLLFVLKLGPLFMKQREAFVLRTLLLGYNLAQVVLSTVIFIKTTTLMTENGVFETSCVIDTNEPKYKLLSVHHLYFLAKITELLDTIFFVLRKKWSQVSFLHVYHHACITALSWVGLKYEPAYSYLAMGVLNSFVHIVMYAYYGLSAFPELRKYLWWKKYITKLQLTQFVSLLVYMLVNTFTTNCPNSKLILMIYFIHMFLFLYLFTNFYTKSYTKKQTTNNLNIRESSSKKGILKVDSDYSAVNRIPVQSELNTKFEKSR